MHVYNQVVFLVVGFLLINITASMSPYERMIKRESTQGLYGPNDKVIIVTAANIEKVVFNNPKATFLEFYNAYCGTCQRFSSVWKEVGTSIAPWNSIVEIAAIDCASDENNAVCREHEIMRYPTMRYMPPNYQKGKKQIGTNLDHLNLPTFDDLLDEITIRLVNETEGGPSWPNFDNFDGNNWKDVFNEASLDTKFVYIVNDNLLGYLPQQVVLDHINVERVDVRIVDGEFRLIPDKSFKLGVVDPKGDFKTIPVEIELREEFSEAISNHLKQHHLLVATTESPPKENDVLENGTDSAADLLNRFFYDKARSMKPMPLFRADLEQAIRNTLNHEVIQRETISGESLSALRNFVSVLARYYTYGNKNSYKKLLDYLMEPSVIEVNGSDLQTFLKNLDPPIVHESQYIGCFSTQAGKRRFPCSLWSLFHHLTVQHLESEDNEDPMEVLYAMHGYISHFFGCSDCAKHFKEMAKRNNIWNVTSKDQAVLWLWSAHNEVNQRLAGDLTEDKNHPKIQFPNDDFCHACRKSNGDWDKQEVLEFMRRHYGNSHINDMGLDQPRALKLNARARQIFAGGANNTHLHIGILAYVVIIICLMVVAVKFYFRRGYRKKLYHHDLLGKV
ncbi:CLUMA_CG004364, isoform A [Clunio marinus]|uniref:Sulfhydryl oxidase n=1 Tax=Clunio marinus TaxID=568069 RepID=A0A1J1HRI7_9DIPT|nr:CLUMA_CG004364, isoform A [Clunio marinus]